MQKPHIALITGSANGIGRATAIRLHKDGMYIVAVDRDRTQLDELCRAVAGERIDPVVCDLRHWQQLDLFCTEILARFGPVRYLVNNAGVWDGASLTEMSDETWSRNLDINVSAPFALMRGLCPAMKSIGGAVVNIASRNAFRSSTHKAAYDASKAALVALTRTAAGELAGSGIRVNAVCPGVVSVPSDSALTEDAQFKAAYTRLIPMDRYGLPEEIADAVAFLLSDQASFITGQSLVIDGGQLACQDNERFMQILTLRQA